MFFLCFVFLGVFVVVVCVCVCVSFLEGGVGGGGGFYSHRESIWTQLEASDIALISVLLSLVRMGVLKQNVWKCFESPMPE